MTPETTTEESNLPVQRTVLSPVDSLTDALQTERRLLDELIAVMRRQRDAVGADDLQSVDDSVFATHRVLVTLSEARRRRRNLNTLIGQREDLGIHSLDEVLGPRMTAALRAARDDLHNAARSLSREVAINRRILRQALACGDEYARTLAGVAGPAGSPTYSVQPPAAPPRAQQTTTLLDRRI
ncbi:MAG TPA: flagellar export chaperone FlgN [Gemmatimonadaceae bacterium]|nr:flagellar export chaperone FlgN [Gemmatimonadaceae bacterium]